MMQPGSVHSALHLVRVQVRLYMPKTFFISVPTERARANLQVDEDMDYP